MDAIQSTTDLIVEVNKEKGIYTVHMRGYPECNLCYEVFDSVEYLNNLKTGKNFPHRNFMIDDIIGLLGDEGVKTVKNIINILWIRTINSNRNKGYATNLMQKFLDIYKDSKDKIIVLRAAAMTEDYPEEPTNDEYAKYFEHMQKFIVPFGFHSIQTLCGLEFSEPYLYLSPTSLASKTTWNAFTEYEYKEGIKYAAS